jgi:hypothetical protein
MSFNVPMNTCLSCGIQANAATSVGYAPNKKPTPGDVTVCFKCGHIMLFGDKLELREPTAKEAYAIAGDKRILAIQHARKKFSDEDEGKEP